MKSGWFLVGLGCLLVGAAGVWFATPLLKSWLLGTGRSGGGREEGRPNVVLISVDTTRPDHLGCYGYGRNTSPHIDQLAREGIRFSRAYSQAPWTLPSHMSLFTSVLPS